MIFQLAFGIFCAVLGVSGCGGIAVLFSWLMSIFAFFS